MHLFVYKLMMKIVPICPLHGKLQVKMMTKNPKGMFLNTQIKT